MRIGLIVPGFSADADDWCIPALRDFVRRLTVTDEVHVFALRYPPSPRRYSGFGAEVTALGGGSGRGRSSVALWPRAFAAIASQHRQRPFDVLHAFWATESGALTAVAGRVLGVPTLVSLAGGELVGRPDLRYGDQLAVVQRVQTRLALRLANVVAAGSSQLLRIAAPWLRGRPASTIRRLPLGVDLARFQPGPRKWPGGPPRLLQVASLVPVKDQETLLRAAAHLQNSNVAFELELVGSGPLAARLRDQAGQLGIEKLVCWRGEVAHDQLPEVYRAADVFVVSSRHEAQGIALLEAAASGCTIVGTEVGVIPELAPAAAVAVPVQNPTALAAAIASILREPRKGQALGEAGRLMVEREFELGTCVQRFREVYTALADTASTTRR